ncbi:MAG: M48 family metalloprotease, partial [Planctomycetota bacterium]|nr:M48 family metalloprotease [Planctomycetota bacterium]
MPGTFFEHQERARRRTWHLLFLFALAVLGIATGIYFVIAAVFAMREDGVPWDPELFVWVAGGTVAFIGLASLIRIVDLRKGGAAVAGMLGGRQVSRDTNDPAERRLLNIVDEMAIASGIPVPDVYVLDGETGINAFAAGYNVGNAVVAVTRGAMEKLDRDELQGVVAHEFSHILNGDMKLNIRLIGILFGILAVAAVGRTLLKIAFRVPSGRRDRKGTHPAIILLGLALLIIGYIGVFVGRLIQAAVSRQREFLADASAVQFTRNPYGIGGALLKIAGMGDGSYMESPRAEEVGHLLFGEGRRVSFLSRIFSSHPPIEERIRRISPELLRGAARPQPRTAVALPAGTAGIAPVAVPTPAGAAAPRVWGAGQSPVAARPAEFMARVGVPGADSVGFAADIIAAMPDRVLAAAREPEGAACLISAAILDTSEPVRKEQLRLIAAGAGAGAADRAADLYELIAPRRNLYALPLVEVSAPALRTWPRDRQEAFLRTLRSLIMADNKVTLFEFGIWWLATRRLARSAGPDRP